MKRICTIINGSVGGDRDAADDGAYDLLDATGTPEEIGKAIADSLRECDLLRGGRTSFLEDMKQPVYLNITIRVEPEGWEDDGRDK
jgi:hypothetical protein